MFGNNTFGGGSQHAMDIARGNRGRRGSSPNWRSPYNNPDLEYVYLGSPQTSQGSPQTHLPDPVTSFVSSNLHNLQSTPGNIYQQQPEQQGFAAAVMACAQSGYVPMPDPSYQHYLAQRLASQQMNYRAETQSQASSHGLYGVQGETDTQQFDDIWTILESDLAHASVEYNVTPENINLVDIFASQGFNHSSASMPTPLAIQRQPSVAPNRGPSSTTDNSTWTMLSHIATEEAQSSTSGRGGYNTSASIGNTTTSTSHMHGLSEQQGLEQGYAFHHRRDAIAQNSNQAFHHGFTLPNTRYGNVAVDPIFDFMDTVMDDQISDDISSTARPGTGQSRQAQQMRFGYGAYGNNPGGFRDHHAAALRFSQPENNFREQMQGELPTFDASGSMNIEARPIESEFSQLLAPGQSGIRHLGETRWAEQLLNLCAAAIASKNISRTQHLMWVLNDLASVVGDANQRFAAYGLRALFCRITGKMEAAATFLRPRHKEQEVSFGPKTVHRALVKFHEYVPWHQNCYSVTSQILLEVCAGKSRLHLIDIGAGKGIEWPIFIDALVSRSGGPPSLLRMTMIRDLRREELNMHTAKSVNSEAADFMTRLVKFASLLGLHVEVNMVQKPLECVTREDLRLRDGEILAVVCQFRLHRLSEEPPARQSSSSPPPLSPRDEFLKFLYKLEPHVFIQSDNDSDHCSHDFLTRFENAIGFWWRCFEAIDIGYNGRDPEERQIIEYEGAMMLLNMVACEGIARIERNESYQFWERRIRRAGFLPRDMSEETKKASQNLVQNHSEFWDVAFNEPNTVSLQWRKQPTTFTSVWKVASCSRSSCKCSMLHS
ncbi:hypothetical protein KC19_VG120100 [Ceratodon purpureus]|nr:hypothetical protein KC19_VG120100 [Ceratodon purpureus]KAG0572718.1 hypothetical protein KC19_VG120100 [Ceratodon purpureus]KAG0572722.1 hypothetical protein KC19_VG120100 [Ceratodon purpureus]